MNFLKLKWVGSLLQEGIIKRESATVVGQDKAIKGHCRDFHHDS